MARGGIIMAPALFFVYLIKNVKLALIGSVLKRVLVIFFAIECLSIFSPLSPCDLTDFYFSKMC